MPSGLNFVTLDREDVAAGAATWHVEEGAYGGTDLGGLTFTLAVNWPGAIHEGDGECVLLVDERADDAQRAAIHTLVNGEAGGPWGVLGWTWQTLHGPEPVQFELELDGIHSRVRAGEVFELELEPIRNPVTGAEVTPGAVLPQGIVFKRADFASSRRYRVGRLGIDYAGKTVIARSPRWRIASRRTTPPMRPSAKPSAAPPGRTLQETTPTK